MKQPPHFQSYYQYQLTAMETNPQLQQDILNNLQALPAKRKTKQRLLWLGSAVTVLSGSMIAVLLYVHPKTVTADSILREALATPTLQAGQIYQASSVTTTIDGTTYAATVSDGIHLERLRYDAQHNLIGAELDMPHGDDHKVFDVYSYGDMRQGLQTANLNTIEHIVSYNVDAFTDVSADDPSTFSKIPEGFAYSYGQTSVLQVVSGSSMWRPYVSSDTKTSAFFVDPILSETTLNGVPVYMLDEKQPDIGFEAIAWILKQDGRLLQEQTNGDLTVYSGPTITTGSMPTTVDEFIQTLPVTNAQVKDHTFNQTPGSDAILIMPADDTYSLPDDRALNCGGNVDLNSNVDDTVTIDENVPQCDPQQ